MSRYATTDQANRWARIRELLTEQERALLFNALQDKARGDREAARLAALSPPWPTLVRTFTDQASLADDMADEVLE